MSLLKGKSHRELIGLGRQLIQPLLPNFRKGQAGKIAVIGGCEDYTGAPYFACHSAATIGADLSHVICEKSAAGVIKLYTPDLMVHPYLLELENANLLGEQLNLIEKLSLEEVINQDNSIITKIIEEKILPKIMKLLSRIDLVIVGPGFGRDKLMLSALKRIILEIKVLNIPIILDADSLFLLSINPDIIANYSKAILTPNVIEFDRLCQFYKLENDLQDFDKLLENSLKLLEKLGCSIIQKGGKDIIVNSTSQYLINEYQGSLKRVGGQGDTLVGVIATLVNWSNNYNSKLWDHDGELSPSDSNLLAIYMASVLTRLASNKAFKKYGRSMQTSNVHEFLYPSYQELFELDIKL